MLGQEVSRLLKGTYFAKNDLTMVNLEAETNQIRLLESLSKFLETSLADKKSVQVLDLSEHVEAFIEAEEEEKTPSEIVELFGQIFKPVSSSFVILKNVDLFLELVSKP
jgi:hypothetical protein